MKTDTLFYRLFKNWPRLAFTLLQRVEGPNSIGVYTLELGQTENNRNMTNTIEFLRRQTLIILAEPAIQP